MGVIDALDLVLASGLDRVHRRDRAPARRCSSRRSTCWSAGAPTRPSCARAPQRPGSRAASCVGDDEYIVLAGSFPTDGRSRAYVNGRLATAAHAGRVGRRAPSTCTASTPTRACCRPPRSATALDRFCATDLEPLRAARARLTEIDAALAALGGDQRSRRARGRPAAVPARRAATPRPSTDADEDDALTCRGRRLGRRGRAPRGRAVATRWRHDRRERCRLRRSADLGAAIAGSPAGRRSTTSPRGCRPWPPS